MTPQRWAKIEELFEAASVLTGDARAALLARECADDAGLREEVERMLAADSLHSPAVRQAVAVGRGLVPPLTSIRCRRTMPISTTSPVIPATCTRSPTRTPYLPIRKK